MIRLHRFQKGCKRKKKLANLRTLIGPRLATQVFTSGVLPAIVYGAEVNGISDVELKKIRNISTAAMTGGTTGRSLSASLLLRGDPSWKAGVAPISRWHKEVWRVHHQGRKSNFTAQEIEEAWHVARKNDHEWYKADGSPKWSGVRGPVGATCLSLQRMGWIPLEPFEWIDDLGVKIKLIDMSPKMLTLLLKESSTRKLEREVAFSVGSTDMEGRRACMDPIRSFLATKKRSLKEKAVVGAAGCNALWTRTRVKKAGYILESTKCELCEKEEDTIHHRLYMCTHPKALEARQAVAKKMTKDEDGVWWPRAQKVLDEAIASGSEDPLFLHAVFPHPSDLHPALRRLVGKVL